jgi:hypothetical protein
MEQVLAQVLVQERVLVVERVSSQAEGIWECDIVLYYRQHHPNRGQYQ